MKTGLLSIAGQADVATVGLQTGTLQGKLKGFSSLDASATTGLMSLEIDGKSGASIQKHGSITGIISLKQTTISDLKLDDIPDDDDLIVGGGSTKHGTSSGTSSGNTKHTTSSDNTNHGTSSATASFATSYSIIMALLMMVKMAF